MGIYDRDYLRREPPRGPGVPAGRGRGITMWSVNTWLIVACVLFYFADYALIPRHLWIPTVVSDDLPAHVTIALPLGDDYVIVDQAGAQRRVVERSTGEVVGHVFVDLLPPVTRYLHFSTALTFLHPQLIFEFWRLIGFQFLHANPWHLAFNMLGLFIFGPLVEQYLGSKRYLAFYLLCGIFGGLMYLLLNLSGFALSLMAGQPVAIPGLLFNSTYTPLIGASAGVFGVLMAGAYRAPHEVVYLFMILPMRLVTLAYALVFIALFTVITGGANAGGEAGHLGGALAGYYFIRHPRHLHGFFDMLGWADPTSRRYRGRRGRGYVPAPRRDEVDRILDKIRTQGMRSLSEQEKRILHEASKR